MQTGQGGGKSHWFGCWEAGNIRGRFTENEVSVSRAQILTCAGRFHMCTLMRTPRLITS